MRSAGEGIPAPQICAQLRNRVRHALDNELSDQAVFLADKLVTLTSQRTSDVHLLATAFVRAGHHQRALHLLERCNLAGQRCDRSLANLRFEQLAAQCLVRTEQWDECIDLLEGCLSCLAKEKGVADDRGDGGTPLGIGARAVDDQAFERRWAWLPACAVSVERELRAGLDATLTHDREVGSDVTGAGESDNGTNIVSVLCYLHAKALHALEKRDKATDWFKMALHCDCRNVDAFNALVDGRMLCPAEEERLVQGLAFEDCDEWLRIIYQSHINKYDQDLHAKFKLLEGKHALSGNAEVLATQAGCHYHLHDARRALVLAKQAWAIDPFVPTCTLVQVCALVELRLSNELFLLAHQLVDRDPNKAMAWFAVGCYYLLVRKYELAQQYFHKATTMDGALAAGWMGRGHAFAALDESDQAMMAYRTAMRLFRGSHLPLLAMAIENLRTNNVPLASEFLLNAARVCPEDPLCYNELGVVAFRKKQWQEAEAHFVRVYQMTRGLPTRGRQAWEGSLFNLGHTYRKQRKYDQAIQIYEEALSLAPDEASTYSALGFTWHLKGQFTRAVDLYHKSLGLKPGDSFTTQMLKQALEEELEAECMGAGGGTEGTLLDSGGILDDSGVSDSFALETSNLSSVDDGLSDMSSMQMDDDD